MKYFDLHCDTALRLYSENQPLSHNSLHISLDRLGEFEKYIQLTAIFTPPELSDSEGWEQFLKVHSNLINETYKNGVKIIKNRRDLESFLSSEKKCAIIITVEDARILDRKIERVRQMYGMGVRVITPMWGSSSCIGCAHNFSGSKISDGLTNFGKRAIRRMISCGIIPDISHASRKSAREIMDLCEECGVSPIATHSNSFSVHEHTRNLTDEEFLRLTSLGGISGISLCPAHLASGKASAKNIVSHALLFEILAKNHVSLGCDFDGTDLPDGIGGISEIPYIRKKFIEHGFSETETEQIFWETAVNFFLRNLPNE